MSFNSLKSLRWFLAECSEIKEIPEEILKLSSLEVVKLEDSKIESGISKITRNKSIKFLACKTDLLTEDILKWLQKQELRPFGEKSFKKREFFAFPIT